MPNPTPDPIDRRAVQLARAFHDAYEELAPQFGYTTREDTRVFDPASPNGRLMIAVCARIASLQACPVAQPEAPQPAPDPVFTITPCGHDVRVEIHQTADDLRQFVAVRYGQHNPQGGAFTKLVDGVVYAHFAADLMLLDFVAHEALHVAICVAAKERDKDVRWSDTDDCEEDMAEIAGEFVRLFWNHFLGLDDSYHVAMNQKLFASSFAAVIPVVPEPQPALDVAAIIEKAREYANDMDGYSRWGSCFTDCANALTTLAARLAEVERERDEWKSYKDRVEVSERERDTDRARLHASDDLAVKNAIERDAYKESVQGAGVVIQRIKAERDAALTRAAAAEKALAEALKSLEWGHAEMKGRPPQHWLDSLEAIRRVLPGGE